VTIAGTAGSVEAGARVRITNLRTGETVEVLANSNGAFSTQIAAATGDQFKVVVLDAAGNISPPASLSVPSWVDFTIDSPANGAVVSDDVVLVSGSFSSTATVGMAVNGIPASVAGNSFQAVVPLVVGANTITVVASTMDGSKTTKTIDISSTGSPLRIQVSPNPELAGLPIFFSVSSSLKIVRIEADFNGDGSIDQTVTNPASEMKFSYPASGIYNARFKVLEAQGLEVEKTVPVIVQDAAELDQACRAAWAGFVGALAGGNRTSALTYLSTGARERYSPVFDALAPQLGQIVGDFSVLQKVTTTSGLGEYAVNRTIDGVNRIFLIYFLQSEDGLWRIDGM
jgi:hypothetical protein